MHGRRRPYTVAGVRRVSCARCGNPARHQWSICSDGNLQRPICLDCDIALNRLVLRWMGFPDWREKIASYTKQIQAREGMTMAKKPTKPAAKRGGAKKVAPAPKAKARTKKPSKTARKKAARVAPAKPKMVEDITSRSFSGIVELSQLATSAELGANYGATAPAHPAVEEQYQAEAHRYETPAAKLDNGRALGAAAARGAERARKPRWWTRFRSSITGLFTSRTHAESDPDATYGQRIERKG